MLFIFTALHPEAKPLIQKFHMKRIAKPIVGNAFPVYEDSEKSKVLCITGTGPIQAATAVGSVLTAYEASSGDALLNVGTAAGLHDAKIGECYLGNRLRDLTSGRDVYPDLFVKNDFPEAEIRTGARVLFSREDSVIIEEVDSKSANSLKTAGPILYDMESAAVFQAGSSFLGTHQMHFLRIVSDFSEGAKVTAEGIGQLIEPHVEAIASYVENVIKLNAQWEKENEILPDTALTTVENFAEDAHFSKVMQDRFLQLIRYLSLTGFPWETRLQDLYREGVVPTRDKRAGKGILERIEMWVSASEERQDEGKPVPVKTSFDEMQPPFQHIYVEKELFGDPATEKVLSHFPKAKILPIRHYKDVFNRRRQDVRLQHQSRNLILAKKHGQLVYPGAPVCQSFGNQHFYYTSCLMNCIFDCEYCYLKGMYPSGNLVLFLNLEDIFQEVRALLRQHPVYLCVSYDTDLLAVEDLTGFVAAWIRFVKEEPDLSIEIRTKSARRDLWERFRVLGEGCDRVIFAFTISPEPVVSQYEHHTGHLEGRLANVNACLSAGYPARLCFDPMIVCPDWQRHYRDMLQEVRKTIPMENIRDVSVGSFRLSEDYLKNMRRAEPCSAVVQYPYENDHGVMHYPKQLTEEMEQFLIRELRTMLPEERIFRWEEQE